QLAVLELGLVLLLGWSIAPRNDLGVAQKLKQVLALLARQVQAVALVGPHAPVLVVLAAGRGLVEILAAGPPERCDGDLDLATVEVLNVLHASLAVGALAHDDRPLMVLETGRDDLAGAGAHAVDQADHRETQLAAARHALHAVFQAKARPADA